jgi:hypothetical protein
MSGIAGKSFEGKGAIYCSDATIFIQSIHTYHFFSLEGKFYHDHTSPGSHDHVCRMIFLTNL